MRKRITFLATMAIALVACNKSETLVTESADEISFKAVSSVATKANPEVTGTTLPSKDYILYVTAARVGASPAAYFFGETQFVTASTATPLAADDQFKADPAQYWPVGGASLDFLAIACKSADKTTLSPTWTPVGVMTTASWDTWTNQIDLLYASNNGASKATTTALEFKHAQALLAFQAQASVAGQITIKNIEIEDLEHTGTFTVNNTRNIIQTAWDITASGKKAVKGMSDYVVTTSMANVSCDNLLVPQQGKKNITVTYSIAGNEYQYTLNNERTTWEAGKKYVYQFNITLTEIVFTESVSDWDTTSPAGNIEVPVI